MEDVHAIRGPRAVFGPEVAQHLHAARTVRRDPVDIIFPSPEELEESDDANILEEGLVIATLALVEVIAGDDDDVHVDENGDADKDTAELIAGLGVIGVVRGENARQRYAQNDAKKPSKYQIDIGNGATANVMTVCAILTSFQVTNKGAVGKMSADRLRRVVQMGRSSKVQASHAATAIVVDLVEEAHAKTIFGGSWVALAFEDGPRKFRCWFGMLQRITNRAKSKKATLHAGALVLDVANVHDYWCNIAWLKPCDGVDPKTALQYEWLLPCVDTDEQCAACIISIPDITFCADSKRYTLCRDDLKRINDVLDSMSEGDDQDDDLVPAPAAAVKPARKQNGGGTAVGVDMEGFHVTAIAGQAGKRNRMSRL